MKQLVKKANSLVETPYKLSAREQKIILFLISKIHKDDDHFCLYKMNVQEFKSIAELKGKSFYSELIKITNSLQDKRVPIPDNPNLMVRWLASCEYKEGQGCIEIEISQKLKPYLLQLKKRFTQYQLKNVIKMKSAYSIRMYELLKQYEKIAERVFSLENLKTILGIQSNQYKLYADFRRRVLLQAEKEINQKSDLSFTFTEKKRGRKVIGIVFKIKSKINVEPDPPDAKALPAPIKPVQNQNPKIQNQVIETTPVSTISENILILIPQEYVENQDVLKNIRKYLKTHNEEYVINEIQYACQNFKKEGGFPGYFAQSLKNSWGNTLEAMRQQKKQLAEAKAEQEAKLKVKREAEEKRLESLKKEFETYSQNKRDEALARLPEDEKKVFDQEFKEQFLKKGFIQRIFWENGGFDNRNVQFEYEDFVDERFLPEEDRVFEIWAKNKGHNR
ncbi:putative Initiator Rep protein WH1 domain-containing protein [Candidatus Magnetomoraceae bacterium gMMP-1]